jgi:hypothetical protein
MVELLPTLLDIFRQNSGLLTRPFQLFLKLKKQCVTGELREHFRERSSVYSQCLSHRTS